MGEQKRRRRANQAVLDACPYCIYCGAQAPATTIEHMPPRMMFNRKDRPKGLEFSSCRSCNEGTSRADLVASMLARVYPNPSAEEDSDEYRRLLRALNNNIPRLLEEMQIGRGGQKLARKRVPSHLDGGFLRVDGPLVSNHMEAFSAKVGFALHYEAMGHIIPRGGGVFARWYSNVDKFEGNFPDSFAALLPSPLTLRQGKKEVSNQFQYSFRSTDDGDCCAVIATFRLFFAVVAISSVDKKFLDDRLPSPSSVWGPGDIVRRLKAADGDAD